MDWFILAANAVTVVAQLWVLVSLSRQRRENVARWRSATTEGFAPGDLMRVGALRPPAPGPDAR